MSMSLICNISPSFEILYFSLLRITIKVTSNKFKVWIRELFRENTTSYTFTTLTSLDQGP